MENDQPVVREPWRSASRRDLIAKAIVAGGVVWTVPTLFGGVAAAAGGTPACQPPFGSPGYSPVGLFSIASTAKNNDPFTVTMSLAPGLSGTPCPCGGPPLIEYFFAYQLAYKNQTFSDATSGWQATSPWTSTKNPGLTKYWKKIVATLSWGIRVQCTSGGNVAWDCRYGTFSSTDLMGGDTNIYPSSNPLQLSLALTSLAGAPPCDANLP